MSFDQTTLPCLRRWLRAVRRSSWILGSLMLALLGHPVLADQAAGESLGQAAPVIANLPAQAIRDVLPIPAKRRNTSATITLNEVTTQYGPAQLFSVTQTQPNGFVGALFHAGRAPLDSWSDVALGMDSSLMATVGWDNATGYGVPNGLLFIEAARWFARGQ